LRGLLLKGGRGRAGVEERTGVGRGGEKRKEGGGGKGKDPWYLITPLI